MGTRPARWGGKSNKKRQAEADLKKRWQQQGKVVLLAVGGPIIVIRKKKKLEGINLEIHMLSMDIAL